MASIAAILSLALAGPASAGGPLSGLTDAVSNVTTGVGQTVDSVGTVVEDVTGAQQSSSSGSQDPAAQPEQAPAPAADTNAAPQPAAPAPTAVTAVTAVTRKVVAETVPAIAATTNRLASAASDAAEPVIGAALGNVRAVTGSAVAATGAAVAELSGVALTTVANVTEPVLPVTGAVLGTLDATISTATTGLVGSVDELLPPPRSQGSNGPAAPQPGQGSGGGVTGDPVPPGEAADTPGPAKRMRKAAKPQAQAAEVPVAPTTQVLETPPIIYPGSPPRAAAGDGGTAVPSLAPPMRTAAPSTGSSAAGGASGLAFVGFAVLAGLFVLAAPALGRRLKLWPALVRPLAFVSPPERPG